MCGDAQAVWVNARSEQCGQAGNPALGQKGRSAGMKGTTAFRGRYNKAENSAASVGGKVSEKWFSLLATENGQQGCW